MGIDQPTGHETMGLQEETNQLRLPQPEGYTPPLSPDTYPANTSPHFDVRTTGFEEQILFATEEEARKYIQAVIEKRPNLRGTIELEQTEKDEQGNWNSQKLEGF